MIELLKHECGVAMIRLLKPLDYYERKYGTWAYGFNKLFFGHRNALKQNELMRNLDHNAGSIAVLSYFCPTMAHVLKHMQCIVHQFVTLAGMDVHYHSDTTGIVFVVSLIEPLGILITISIRNGMNPSRKAASAIDASSSRLVVGSCKMRLSTQAFSQRAGQTRPVNSGKGLVDESNW